MLFAIVVAVAATVKVCSRPIVVIKKKQLFVIPTNALLIIINNMGTSNRT